MQELDPRVIEIGIEVDGAVRTYTGLMMTATGTKYANSLQNECEVKIYNLDKETQDFILSETSPFNLNRTPKSVTVNAGRKSYGTTLIFKGNIASSTPTQPPDIGVTLKCLTGNFQKGDIVSVTQPGTTQLSAISRQTAANLGLNLDFQASDKQIKNYQFSGAALKQVDALNDTGQVSAYVDDDRLVVKDLNLPLVNQITIVNLDTGMIGIPEITEQGIKVKFLLDGDTVLGGKLRITSLIYPAVNGDYVIYKLGFDIATRDVPFYWIAEAKRL